MKKWSSKTCFAKKYQFCISQEICFADWSDKSRLFYRGVRINFQSKTQDRKMMNLDNP
jgi:hypothetical protein